MRFLRSYCSAMWFYIAYCYAFIYVFFKRIFGFQISGLGWILRRVSDSRVIYFRNRRMYFEPAVAASYGLHIAGFDQEPETHNILNHIFSATTGTAWFIDIGANVGAFLIDTSRYSNVSVIAFEPSVKCAEAISNSMKLNRVQNWSVHQCLVGERVGLVNFDEGSDPQGASIFSVGSNSTNTTISMVKLDCVHELNAIHPGDVVVLLMDVEGYELNVMRGAIDFIKRHQPLIIFEYNFISKQHFYSNDIQGLLGRSYRLCRLRSDGLLDNQIEEAWNCVAIPQNSVYENILCTKFL